MNTVLGNLKNIVLNQMDYEAMQGQSTRKWQNTGIVWQNTVFGEFSFMVLSENAIALGVFKMLPSVIADIPYVVCSQTTNVIYKMPLLFWCCSLYNVTLWPMQVVYGLKANFWAFDFPTKFLIF